jgi:hypothetical protein
VDARWSPDGAWIVYRRRPRAAVGVDRPLDPTAGRRAPVVVGAPTVRTDADLWRIPADGWPPRSAHRRPGDDRSASWSPDGTRLAFDSTRDGNTELYVMGADGSGLRRLTDDPAEDWGASWSPSGDGIAFASTRDGLGDIYVVDPAGGVPRRVTRDLGWAKGPTWSPDGTRIAFTSGLTGEEDVYSVAADGSDLRNLSRSPGSTDDVWDGRWGRDGRIVYERSGDVPAELSNLVRDDLAALMVLVQALVVALLVVVVLRIRPPFGAYAVILGLGALFVAASVEEWRVVPAATLTGLVVDVAVRYAPPGRAYVVAGAVAAGAFVLTLIGVAAATTGIAWTATVVVGMIALAAVLGGLIGAVAGPGRAPAAGATLDEPA